jgi:hypothetical protein
MTPHRRKAGAGGAAGGAVALALALALSATACGDSGGSSSAGTEIVPGRDIADLFFWNQDVLGYTRQTQDPSQPEPQDLWLWNVPNAAASVALAGIDWAPPAWWPSFVVGNLLLTGSWVYNLGSMAATDLTTVGVGQTVTTSVGMQLTSVRRDGGAVAFTLTNRSPVAVGTPPDFSVVTPNASGGVVAMDFIGADLAVAMSLPQTNSPTVIYRVEAGTGNVTTLLDAPSLLDKANTSASCGQFASEPCTLFRVAGCAASDPPCPGGATIPPCMLFYVGLDPSDPTGMGTVGYAYNVKSGTNTKLDGTNPIRFDVSSDQHTVVWYSTATINGTPLSQPQAFNLCTQSTTVCPPRSAFSTAAPRYADATVWSPDGAGFASYVYGGPTSVARLADQSCSAVPDTDTHGVLGAQYAPSGDRLLWIASDGNGGEIINLGDATGAGASVIATGSLAGVRFSPDGARLYMARTTSASVSLSWLDLSTSPPPEETIADNYGGISRIANRRALFVDHWNSQDATGELTLVDIPTGTRQRLAQAVTGFTAWGSIDDGGTNVAYTVRGRVASGRDGLWLTALPP